MANPLQDVQIGKGALMGGATVMKGISIGPGDVAGFLRQLRNGFEELGIPCEHFLFIPSDKFAYGTHPYFLSCAYESVQNLRMKGLFLRYFGLMAEKAIRLSALFYAILRYDVFIFSGFGSFFRFFELPVLRLLGKQVIVIYLGSDARPPYLSGKHLDDNDGVFEPKSIAAEARNIRSQMKRVERYASVIVNHTGTAQFSQKPFVRLDAIGLPMRLSLRSLAEVNRANLKALRILHAPSRPVAKGTHRVRAAVHRMREEGIPIELIELIGVPNSEVLRHLANCDIVVDELYSDVPLATLGAEAAAFGKPVIVCSLYASDFHADNPRDGPIPSVFARPDEFETVLRQLVCDPVLRREQGKRGQEFLSQATPGKVAARILRLVEGPIPPEWLADPQKLDYVGGWGLSESAWRDQMVHYLAEAGDAGLALQDKPHLISKIHQILEGRPVP